MYNTYETFYCEILKLATLTQNTPLDPFPLDVECRYLHVAKLGFTESPHK